MCSCDHAFLCDLEAAHDDFDDVLDFANFCIENRFRTIENLTCHTTGGIHCFGNFRRSKESRSFKNDVNRLMRFPDDWTQELTF